MTTRLSLADALKQATQTKGLEFGPGAIDRCADLYERFFPGRPALVIADPRTFAAAGRRVWEHLRAAKLAGDQPFILDDPELYAEHRFVERLQQAIQALPDSVPVAVGSGTINDLTKLAAHRAGRPYLAVATAASMDGYTAFGASITYQGSKQTFACPAPLAVVADLDVIAAAPSPLNAAGYADLLAKTCGGADWLLADALGVEPLHPQAWCIVQGSLLQALADPDGVRWGEPEAVRRLTEGLLLSGFGMQAANSSRPASGAEHQFSHLWDMQHHTHEGKTPLHGFKVAVGSIASTALYEHLLAQPLEALDVDRCCAEWPARRPSAAQLRAAFPAGDLLAVATQESAAKDIDAGALRDQLLRLRRCWPELAAVLRRQLLPLAELKQNLQAAGAPFASDQIGISRERLRQNFWQAWCIRRRFTVLDVAARTGLLEHGAAQAANRF